MIVKQKRKQKKVFCVGLNKTGTTSIEKALSELGYKLGNQREGELLFNYWKHRNFSKILKHCYTAEAFQDIPFSLPYTFLVLDQHFPNSKFILTKRDDAEQWYQSISKFHSKLWANGVRIPNKSDLKEANYIEKGMPFKIIKGMFNTPDHNLYNKDILIKYYLRHNKTVRDYFRYLPEKFIEVNVSVDSDYFRLCDFLDRPPKSSYFPWMNKTTSIKK